MQALGVDPAFWSGRRVFVTGHTGFMGGWLALWLTELGATVAGYALDPPTRPSLYDAIGLRERLCSVIGDVRDGDRLTAAMADFAPDIVMHLAAQPLVGRAHRAPVETFSINVMGTVNLLQAIRHTESVTAAIVVTTDKVYLNREWPWGYRERDRLGGDEPYGASKACAEFAVDAYRGSYFSRERPLGVATVRAGNIIGGGDWAENRLVPDAVRAFTAGTALDIRNPAAVRPWQHVLEPVRGYLMLAQRLAGDHAAQAWQGAWNFGPAEDDSVPVGQVADRLAALWGDGARWKGGAEQLAARETRLLMLNSGKSHAELGWQPAWRLERALSATVEWYRAHLAGKPMLPFSLRQIAHAQGVN